MSSRKILHDKLFLEDGAIIEMKVTKVPKCEAKPEGYKYSFAYIDPLGHRLVGYDNSKGQGHHRHFLKTYEKITFHSVDDLIRRFYKDISTIRGKTI